ncbi:MAG TPA: hypothetical protein VM509_07895 [Planctomycetota bacterium]|nr:hypothetical protein [Planctomycetota bacterium]
MTRGLARSWPWLCVLVGIGALTGIVLGLLQPNTYESTTKLVLRSGAREQLTAESVVELEGGHLTLPPTMHDELQMLMDPAIFEQVARDIGPRDILEPADPARQDGKASEPVHWMHALQAKLLHWSDKRLQSALDSEDQRVRRAAKKLLEDTEITNELNSSVIVVKHTSTSPERARHVARTLADAFINRHKDQFSIRALVEASRIKLDQAKTFRDEAATAYMEQIHKFGFAELDPQVPVLTTELTRLEDDLRSAKARQRAIVKQRAILSGHLEDVPPELRVVGPPVLEPNEEYASQLALRSSLVQKKAEISLLSLPKAERARQQSAIDEQIRLTEEKLSKMPHNVPKNAELRESNTEFGALSTKVEDLDLEEKDIEERVASLTQYIGEKKTIVEQLKREQLTATLRQKDLDTARTAQEANYQQQLTRFSALEALGNIDMEEDANLRVLQAATLEPDKVGPRRFSLLLKGAFAGLILGLAFAVLRQRLDRKLTQPDLFERTSGLAVLGVVPDMPELHRLPKRMVIR